MSTIRDIAKQAGVSVSTASLALNGDARVRPATRERVEQAAEALQYHPTWAARSLSSGRTHNLQLVNPMFGGALTSGFHTRFLHGLHDLARASNYSVGLTVIDDEAEAGSVLDALMLERRTDGVILMNPSEDAAMLERLAAHAFPHVVLGRSPGNLAASVDNDSEQVGFDAAEHLLDRAGDALMFLAGPSNRTFTQDRATGFRRALDARGLHSDPALEHFVEGDPEVARAIVREALASGPGFRGIVATSDALAIGALRALREAGMQVPRDVAIIGMNNDDVVEYVDPPLSSVELNAYTLGEEAGAMLLARIEDPAAAVVRHIVEHGIVVRDSSG